MNHFFLFLICCTCIVNSRDKKINKGGGVLIFTTHYPELLDEFESNDNIFFTRNMNGITVDNLGHLLKRNDIKKSEIYQSSFFGGTAPQYQVYIDLKKSLMSEDQKVE